MFSLPTHSIRKHSKSYALSGIAVDFLLLFLLHQPVPSSFGCLREHVRCHARDVMRVSRDRPHSPSSALLVAASLPLAGDVHPPSFVYAGP